MILSHTTDKPAPPAPRPTGLSLTPVPLADGRTAYTLTATR